VQVLVNNVSLKLTLFIHYVPSAGSGVERIDPLYFWPDVSVKGD